MDSPALLPVAGQVARGCWLGYGSALFLLFGELQPLAEGQAHANGEWELINMGQVEWRIEEGERVIAASGDTRDRMEAGVARLEGRRFVSGRITGPLGDALLDFGDGLVLRSFAVVTESDARWLLRDWSGAYTPLGAEPVPSASPLDPERAETA